MKITKKLVLVCSMLLSNNIVWAESDTSGKEGGGGDAYALEFSTLAGVIADQLTQNKVVVRGVDAKQFADMVEQLKVITIEKTVLNSIEVDAINYPAQIKIELNRARWKEYDQDIQKKLNLIFHEIVSLMNLDDKNYQISRSYLAQMDSFALSDKVAFDGYTFCLSRVLAIHGYNTKINWSRISVKEACSNENPTCVGRLVAERRDWAPSSLTAVCKEHVNPFCVEMVAKANKEWHGGVLFEACSGDTAVCVGQVVRFMKPGLLPQYLKELCDR